MATIPYSALLHLPVVEKAAKRKALETARQVALAVVR
jgi:hypothetical protein